MMTRFGVIACLVATTALLAAPAIGLPPCGNNCFGVYEDCAENLYQSTGTLSTAGDNMCATLEAGCWNNCIQSNYTYCKTTYNIWCNGQYYSNVSWMTNAEASTYCDSYLSVSKMNNCW